MPRSAGRRAATEPQDPKLAAAQAALAAEHAAVYGYGVVGAWAGEPHRAEVDRLYTAHRQRRDALRRTVRELGGTPVAAAAGYALPFAVNDGPAALALAAVLEERLAGAYADLVRAGEGRTRLEAAEELRRAALRAARWSGGPLAFPGLAEYGPDAAGQRSAAERGD
jgi:aspartate/methionine/tyrosine aminotransferase